MRIESSKAEAKTAIALAALNSQLEDDDRNELSLAESLAKRERWREECLLRRREQLIAISFPWWIYLRNPFWLLRFEVRRFKFLITHFYFDNFII